MIGASPITTIRGLDIASLVLIALADRCQDERNDVESDSSILSGGQV